MKETLPQLEDGHIRIANELYDAILSYPFTGRQLKVVLAIMRKTYGFGKKQDDVSASQIGSICGMSRTHATSTMNQLAEMNVITKQPGVYGSIVGMNKAYSTWRTSTESVQVYQNGTSTDPVQGVPKSSFASTESVQVDSTESVHTKDNLPKDNTTKAPSEKISLSADGEWEHIPDALKLVWAKAYPALSLDAELSKAAAWILSNPKNKKSNYSRFLTNWLSRAQDNAPRIVGKQMVDEGEWWIKAGFESRFDAENAGCNKFIYHQFHDGKRLETTV